MKYTPMPSDEEMAAEREKAWSELGAAMARLMDLASKAEVEVNVSVKISPGPRQLVINDSQELKRLNDLVGRKWK